MFKVEYPSKFIKALISEFPENQDLHDAAKAGDYKLGNKIADCMGQYPNDRKKYHAMFSVWCALPCVLDRTTQLIIS